MKKLIKHTFCMLLISFLFNGCQSVKDGLTGQKKNNSDEFLIEKKNPLVLPPEYSKLPVPETLNEKRKNDEKEIDIKKILRKQTAKTEMKSADSNISGSLEKSILEKIKEN